MDTLTLGAAFVAVLIIALAYVYYQKSSSASSNAGLSLYEQAMKDAEDKKKAGKDGGEESDVDPFPGGKMTIYFGSQTGTAEGNSRKR